MDKPRHPQVIRPWKMPPKPRVTGTKADTGHTHAGKKHTETLRFKKPRE